MTTEYELPSAPVYDGQEWRTQAACKGLDTNLFFPARGDSLMFQLARQVCDTCPVRIECRDYALQFSEHVIVGIWGGLSGKDRRNKRRAVEL